MVFEVGNRLWEARSTHGRQPIFKNPEQLWAACCEYFEWVEANPLMESKLASYQGHNEIVSVPKMRAMTISGLCLFLDIHHTTWREYRNNNDFSKVASRAEEVIYNQKFTGASADLLNANIIARDLGLSDKKELSGGISLTDMSEDELNRKLAELTKQAAED